jgi:hypothetical protein
MTCKITHEEWIDGYGSFTFIRNESYEVYNIPMSGKPRVGYCTITINGCMYKTFINQCNFYTLSEIRDNKLNSILS